MTANLVFSAGLDAHFQQRLLTIGSDLLERKLANCALAVNRLINTEWIGLRRAIAAHQCQVALFDFA